MAFVTAGLRFLVIIAPRSTAQTTGECCVRQQRPAPNRLFHSTHLLVSMVLAAPSMAAAIRPPVNARATSRIIRPTAPRKVAPKNGAFRHHGVSHRLPCVAFRPMSGFHAVVLVLCDSSGHGKCDAASGICECETGWAGDACTASNCPLLCSGPLHGVCHAGECFCKPGWTGTGCEARECPNNWCAPLRFVASFVLRLA